MALKHEMGLVRLFIFNRIENINIIGKQGRLVVFTEAAVQRCPLRAFKGQMPLNSRKLWIACAHGQTFSENALFFNQTIIAFIDARPADGGQARFQFFYVRLRSFRCGLSGHSGFNQVPRLDHIG